MGSVPKTLRRSPVMLCDVLQLVTTAPAGRVEAGRGICGFFAIRPNKLRGFACCHTPFTLGRAVSGELFRKRFESASGNLDPSRKC